VLVNYLHNACFSPTKSALLKAVKRGHFVTWPGIAEEAINKHFKMMPATAMGHMNQRRHNIHSTSKDTISDMEDEVVTPVITGVKSDMVYTVVLDQGHLNTDLMGRFPERSSKGSWYTMMVYSFECNCVMPVAMKIRSST
jgi:hypothetical protein